MSPGAERDRETIRDQLARSTGRGSLFALLLFGLSFLGPIRFIPEGKYDMAAVTFLGLAAVAAFIYWAASRADPKRSVAARALLERPECVTSIEHYVSSSSGGGMKMDWLRVKADGKSFGFRVTAPEMIELAQVLARHCPNATIRVPGFERAAQSQPPLRR